jgi:hypothetical protein
MAIPKTMKTNDLHEATLVSLKFATEPAPLVEETNVMKGCEALTSGDVGSLVFVVRRPG